ncbi:hypothetical protein ACFFF7_04130 [Novosphingobium aquiterrae]|uniref:Uncharacterized protein n=1 Tax=Novosphingobium aquiterrae TaxID=624388 RepID=A0ABV6PFH9_9SPHN
MSGQFDTTPAESVQSDAQSDRAPDPRRHYASPEDLREDVELAIAERHTLLKQWKDEVDAQLAAESEGMSASDPIRAEAEARLASEARRVSDALSAIQSEVDAAA